jgi:hypothetical protein
MVRTRVVCARRTFQAGITVSRGQAGLAVITSDSATYSTDSQTGPSNYDTPGDQALVLTASGGQLVVEPSQTATYGSNQDWNVWSTAYAVDVPATEMSIPLQSARVSYGCLNGWTPETYSLEQTSGAETTVSTVTGAGPYDLVDPLLSGDSADSSGIQLLYTGLLVQSGTCSAPKPALASGLRVAASGGRWLLMAVRDISGTRPAPRASYYVLHRFCYGKLPPLLALPAGPSVAWRRPQYGLRKARRGLSGAASHQHAPEVFPERCQAALDRRLHNVGGGPAAPSSPGTSSCQIGSFQRCLTATAARARPAVLPAAQPRTRAAQRGTRGRQRSGRSPCGRGRPAGRSRPLPGSRPQRARVPAALPAATVSTTVTLSNRGSPSMAARPLRSGFRCASSATTTDGPSSGTSARESSVTFVPGAATSVVTAA